MCLVLPWELGLQRLTKYDLVFQKWHQTQKPGVLRTVIQAIRALELAEKGRFNSARWIWGGVGGRPEKI